MTVTDHGQAMDDLADAYARLIGFAASDGDHSAQARAFFGLGAGPSADYEETGLRQLHAAHDVFVATTRRKEQATTLEMLGQAAAESGDLDLARKHYQESRFLYLVVSPSDATRLQHRIELL